MTRLQVVLNSDRLQGVSKKKLIKVSEPITIAAKDFRMDDGSATVSIVLHLPDGKTAIAQTSLKLFQLAAKMFAAEYGWQDEWIQYGIEKEATEAESHRLSNGDAPTS